MRAAGQDATALENVLRDPEIGDFDVDVMRNGSVQDLRRCLQTFFSKRARDDTLVVHFSCHGLKSESGELYFAAKDTDHELLDATALPAAFVHRCMSTSRAGCTVLFLDCCYAGAFSRGSSSTRASGEVHVLESFAGDKPPGGRGRAVITASNSMEYAFEGPDLADSAPQPSVFTHAVVWGLETGEADRDGDGEVSLDELSTTSTTAFGRRTRTRRPRRTWRCRGSCVWRTAGVAASRSSKPPRRIPCWTTSTATTSTPGRVSSWRCVPDCSTSPCPWPKGHGQELEEIARDDIQQVADQARSALRDIHVAPSPDRLDFGHVSRGSIPRQKSVALGGPPLARHCVAQSPRSWLRVEPVQNGLIVSVDTSTEEHLSGDIVLKGVADNAVVHVEAVVTPARRGEVPEPPGRPPDTDPGTAVIGTEQSNAPPEEPPRSHRAPALAATALALAGTAVITVILAVQGAVEAVIRRSAEGRWGEIENHVHKLVLTPLTVSLITVSAALVLCAFARHDLRARQDRYTKSASSNTGTLISWVKGLGVPALILAAILCITYLVGSAYW